MTEKSLAHSNRGKNKCSIDGCLQKYYASGFCRKHKGQRDYAEKMANPDSKRCDVRGCEKASHLRGWCSGHYAQWRRTGNPTLFKRKAMGATDAEKFWSRVQIGGENECWNWTKALNDGYGSFSLHNITWKSNRYAWFITHGYLPSDLMVLHSCHNRKCCNPRHLRLGTNQDNMDDLVQSGRHPFRLDISEALYRQILQMFETHSVAEISRQLKLGRGTLDNIKHNKHWAHKVYDGNFG